MNMTLSFLYAKIIKRLHGKCVKNSIVDATSKIYSGCEIYNCKIGRYTYIGYDCKFTNTVIGAFCSCSDHIFVGGHEHPLDWVSTSAVFQDVKNSGNSKRFSKHKLPELKQTHIGNDVWIGHNVTIKAGVRIGDGAAIGAGSVVTKDVPPFAIVAGVPAKVIRYRFDESTIKDLLDTEWWNLSDDKLFEFAPYITDPAKFLNKIKDAET